MHRCSLFLLSLALTASPLQGQVNLWRVNCGGGGVSAPSGPAFAGEVPYAPGGGGYVGGSTKSIDTMGGTWNLFANVHKTARRGWSAYRFDVPPGQYLLRLHLADTEFHGALQRIFDLQVEGVTLLEDLDLVERLGRAYGGVYASVVSVTDGRLDLTAGPGSDPPILCGVEIWTAPSNAPPPPAVSGLRVKPGYQRNIVSWDPIDNPTVVGYRLYSSDSAAPLPLTWALPPRYLDDAASLEHEVVYRVAAVDHLGRVGPMSAPVSARAMRSEESSLPVYEIRLDPLDWKELNDKFQTDRFFTVPGTLLFAGRSYPAQVRYRGETSLTAPKKSWKLSFESAALFQGRQQLNLKSHFLDETFLSQEVAMRFFQRAQHDVPDHSYAHVRVNGVYMGVFQELEKINTDYLRARDRDADGNIYSAHQNGPTELGLQTLSQLQNEFDKETNEESSWDDLLAFIDTINNTSDADFPRAIARVLDIDGYLDYISANGFLVDFEAVIRNYHLLHDLELERWEVIAWDNDSSFSYPYIAINFGTEGSWVGNNILQTRVLNVPAFRWRYVEKLEALLAGPATTGVGGQLTAALLDAHGAIRTDAQADIFKRYWEDDQDFLNGPNDIAAKAQIRASVLNQAIPAYQPPAPPTRVWINELMAYNLTTRADEAGDFDDWIELYNAGASPLDVSGMFLTDDLDLPTAWALPPGTMIAPFGRLLVWADEEPSEGPLHATFRLRREGEALALFAADGTTLLDVKHYKPQRADVSLGRTSDGAAFHQLLPTPTPGAPNTAAGNLPPVVTWVKNEPSMPRSTEPVTLSCLVKDADGVGSVELFWAPAGGAFTAVTMLARGGHHYEATLPALPSGSVVEYYLRATDGLGAQALVPADAPRELLVYGVSDPQATDLCINEFLAANDGTFADEAGDFDDWIEIRNKAGVTLNLSGMYLTDDLSNPTRWAFPIGTFLAPGEHLVVWADGEPHEGPLHASFSLARGGEELGLFDSLGAGNALIDSLLFGPQATDVSLGRLPDGGALLVRLFDPSPGLANVAARSTVRFDAATFSGNLLALSAPVRPVVGENMTLFVSGGPPGGAAQLLVGGGVLALPRPLGGTLLLRPAVRLALALDAAGGATVPLAVPDSPNLVGRSVFFQVLPLAGGGSNGVAATVGD